MIETSSNLAAQGFQRISGCSFSNSCKDAKEIEFDAVAMNGEVVEYAISEHIEFAGVHSGDATLVFPAQKIYFETARRIKKVSKMIAKELNISGPFNIQYPGQEQRCEGYRM